MPVIFIHGVNTRDDLAYRREVERRDEMIRRHLIEPLAMRSDDFRDLEIANPYWGGFGHEVDRSILAALETRLRPGDGGAAPDAGAPAWLAETGERMAALLRRARRASRAVGVSEIALAIREEMHDPMARFVGDAVVYLRERGTPAAPGPIVRVVMDALRDTPRRRPGEPMIVLTHSMGANILYDVLTRFDPACSIDAWVSVGAQVPLFEAINAVAGRDDGGRIPFIDAPRRGVTCWLNIHDPGDPLAFRAGRLFAGVRDLEFRSGMGTLRSHSRYFRHRAFYRLIAPALAASLTAPAG